MGMPSNWRARKSSLPEAGVGAEEPVGHRDEGGTICIHSVAVAKEHQGIGLGSILMKSYIQRIKDSKIADRLALLCHDHLIGFYTSLGFENMGPSEAKFGGGGWNNMVLPVFSTHKASANSSNRLWSSRMMMRIEDSRRRMDMSKVDDMTPDMVMKECSSVCLDSRSL